MLVWELVSIIHKYKDLFNKINAECSDNVKCYCKSWEYESSQSKAAVLEDLMNKIEAINIFIHRNFMYANNITQDEWVSTVSGE